MLLLALWSEGAVAAVNPQAAAGDEGGVLRTQEQDRVGDFFQRSHAPNHVQPVRQAGVTVLDLGWRGLVPRLFGPPGQHGVDPNAIRREIERLAANDLFDGCLGSRIDPAPGESDMRALAAEI